MKEQLIEFETAKLAKEKGFSLWTNERFYGKTYDKNTAKSLYTNTSFMMYENNNTPKNDSPTYDAPTQSLLQKWLREVHKIDIFITEGFHIVSKYKVYTKPSWGYFEEFDSYEGALEKGLQKALTLIK
jgi:hypothetical protein